MPRKDPNGAREYRQTPEYRAENLIRQKRYSSRRYQYILSRKDKCILCGESDEVCLDFHHICNKLFDIALQYRSKGIDQVNKEIDKCVVLCSNCHRKFHKKAGALKRLASFQMANLSQLAARQSEEYA